MSQLSPMIAPLLGNAQHMTVNDHTMLKIQHGQQPLPVYPHGIRRPIQPMMDMPRTNQLSNTLPVFMPQTGNNQMLRYGTPYGRQDPIRESVLKLAEMGISKSHAAASKNPVARKARSKSTTTIFRVTPKVK